MKKIIYLLLCLISFNTFSQKVDSVAVLQGELKAEIYKDVKGIVKELASSLQTTSEKVYKILIKQAFVESVVDLILFIGFIVVSICFSRLWLRIRDVRISNDRTRYDDPTILEVLAFALLIVCLISIIVYLCNLNTIIMGIINPEFKVVDYLISNLKPNVSN